MYFWSYKKAVVKLLAFVAVLRTSNGQDFGYDGNKGPTHWGEQYNTCIGKYQSPINIDSLDVDDVCLPHLQFEGFDAVPLTGNLTNNGHTVMATFEHEKKKPTISGGPLTSIYEFAQFHFHWGDNDTYGSEGSIDSHSFPLELHMVFYKKQFKNLSEAMTRREGLVVLAFFYEISPDGNPAYENFTELLENLTEPHSSLLLNNPPTLFEYLTDDWVHYYTYKGSLTTPPCYESVIWMDFKEPISLSHTQLEHFRSLKNDEEHPLTHNYRPRQPKGDRIVQYNQSEMELVAKNKTKIDLNDENEIPEINDNSVDNEKESSKGGSGAAIAQSAFIVFISAILTGFVPRI